MTYSRQSRSPPGLKVLMSAPPPSSQVGNLGTSPNAINGPANQARWWLLGDRSDWRTGKVPGSYNDVIINVAVSIPTVSIGTTA